MQSGDESAIADEPEKTALPAAAEQQAAPLEEQPAPLEVSRLALSLLREQHAGQLAAIGSLERKAATILGFDAVLAGLLLRVPLGSLGWWHLVPLGFAVLTIAVCLITMWTGDYHTGPKAVEFYEEHSQHSELVANEWMLNGLRQALEANRAVADWKAGLVVLAMLGTLTTVVAALVFYFAG